MVSYSLARFCASVAVAIGVSLLLDCGPGDVLPWSKEPAGTMPGGSGGSLVSRNRAVRPQFPRATGYFGLVLASFMARSTPSPRILRTVLAPSAAMSSARARSEVAKPEST